MVQNDPDNDQSGGMLAAALAYAARGWPVHPLTGKRATVRAWPTEASTDADTITGWWAERPEANIGIVTGPRSGLAVLDVAPRSGGAESLAALRARVELPPTLTARTGGGGLHLIYGYPAAGLSSGAHVFGDDLPGLDVKGSGGYIVGAPSVHPDTGDLYVWGNAGVDLAPWPVALDALMSQGRTAGAETAGEPSPVLARVLGRLDGVQRRSDHHVARCPAHTDTAPSLSIRQHADGECSVKCFVGCTTVAILAAVGLSKSDLRRAQVEPVTVVRRASDVKIEPVTWAWADRIPLGSVTVLAGPPGVSKSTLALDRAAKITRGRLPGSLLGRAHDVVVCNAEDSPAHTTVPRLLAAGADLDRVHLLTISRDGIEGDLVLPDDVERLADTVSRTGARMIIVDPLVAHIAGTVDTHRDHSVRRVLAPLAHLADEHRCAVLAVMHLNKSGGTDTLSRLGGSVGFGGAARSVLLVGKDPGEAEGPDGAEPAETDPASLRALVHDKSNLGAHAPTMRYRVVDHELDGGVRTPRLTGWRDAPDLTAAHLLSGPRPDGDSTPAEEAQAFLRTLLADGPLSAREVRTAADDAGHKWRTVERAKIALGVVSDRSGFGASGRFAWRLPATPAMITDSDVDSDAESHTPPSPPFTATRESGGRRDSMAVNGAEAEPAVTERDTDPGAALASLLPAEVVPRTRPAATGTAADGGALSMLAALGIPVGAAS